MTVRNATSSGILIALAAAVLVVAAAVIGLGGLMRVTAGTLPPGYEQFKNDTTVFADGSDVVVQSNGEPAHGSPYFETSDPRYEAYNGSNSSFMLNPNIIASQTFEFRLPASPVVATVHAETPLGPIGVALNGVPLFNQYAGPGQQELTSEIDSFDQYNGHPQNTGVYHYHIVPLGLTVQNGPEALVGFLLDGFPLYGPQESGQAVTNGDLDQYHGHSHATDEYPGGIYHYHLTAEAPYINGDGFYGTAGIVSDVQGPAPTAAPATTATSAPTAQETSEPSATPRATATPTSLAPDTPAPALLGDVDCRGSVNAIDAALILQFVAGLLGSLPCLDAADTNGSGNVNAIDAALILQFSAGLIGSLSP